MPTDLASFFQKSKFETHDCILFHARKTHIILATLSATPKPISEENKKSNEVKTKTHLERETKKTLSNQEYSDLIQSVQDMLATHGTSLKKITNPGIGPQLEGLTRMLGWEKKAPNTSTPGREPE